MSERRDNSGTLGKNQRRQKDTHPEYNGQCQIDGRDYWISAWVKDGRNGKFFSLSFKSKEQQTERQPARPEPADSNPFDDDIPF